MPEPRARNLQVREYYYRLVDVFAEQPFTGNPLAVFPRAAGLDEKAMLRIARELNRSQTSFVFPERRPGEGPQVRVFTPQRELTRLRHPTIGTAFVLEYEQQIARGAPRARIVFQSPDGPISVSVFARVMTVAQPPPELGSIYEDTDAAMAMLGLKDEDRMFQAPIRALSSGIPFLVVPVRTRAALERIQFRVDIWSRTLRDWEAPKVAAFTLEAARQGSAAKMRVFAPDVGVIEEAATESACGPVVGYLAYYGLICSQSSQLLVLEQGAELDRPSFLHVVVERSGSRIESLRVGGQCVSVGEGKISVAVPSDT